MAALDMGLGHQSLSSDIFRWAGWAGQAADTILDPILTYVLNASLAAATRHVVRVLATHGRARRAHRPPPIHFPIRHQTASGRTRTTSQSRERPRSGREELVAALVSNGGHSAGRLHLLREQQGRSESEREASPGPSRPFAPTRRQAVAAAPEAADGLGRVVGQTEAEAAAGRGGGEGSRVGQARRGGAAALGARGRGRAGTGGGRAGPVLRLPARVRDHRHRRDRLHLRVHQPAAGVRDRRLRQRPVRADPGLLRLHRHPDLRVSVVQGCADGEQRSRGARPQRRIPVKR
ncbi:hypothetical protein BDA96_09G189900 [Sorghum bicolor]|uniref:Uncharacterized protein n=1 Tax=Sorghum bicolor TaxID=4558 RepID=A0A921QD83_SORBI|nr:hypothetical protein BDA96_09G189900 [Sorghum bicolor]